MISSSKAYSDKHYESSICSRPPSSLPTAESASPKDDDFFLLVKKPNNRDEVVFDGHGTATTFLDESGFSFYCDGGDVCDDKDKEEDDFIVEYDSPSDYEEIETSLYNEDDSSISISCDTDEMMSFDEDIDDNHDDKHNNTTKVNMQDDGTSMEEQHGKWQPQKNMDKKLVRFDSSLDEIHIVLSLDEYTQDEWNRCWLSLEEKAETVERRLGITIARIMLVSAIKSISSTGGANKNEEEAKKKNRDDKSEKFQQQIQNIIRQRYRNNGLEYFSYHNLLTKTPRALLRMLEKETRKKF